MVYVPSVQMLRALRAFEHPFTCRHCCSSLPPRKPAQIARNAVPRRTFLSEPKPLSKSELRRAKQRLSNRRGDFAGEDSPSHVPSLPSRKPALEDWELTVGIEIHAELNTSRKLFSPASTSLGDTPNTHVSVFDAAVPGAQPQFQKETLLPALRAALALQCEIQPKSGWDRKHYFWWDQPNGYQITQYYEPFARHGRIVLYPHDDIDIADHPFVEIGIKQIQMEQDTAKTTLQPPSTHLIDLNRASHPLIEIITLPQINSPKTAAALVRKVQSILKIVDANTTGMEMGGLRADVNVSVRPRNTGEPNEGFTYGGITGLGQRTEIKNLNSFKAIEEAIEAERNRQISVLESGGVIEGETRGWTLGGVATRKIRGKEGEVDYRYMPDPDLGPLLIGQDVVDHLRETLPPLPDDMLKLLTEGPAYGVSIKDAKTLVTLDDGDRLDYYLHVVHLTRLRLVNSPMQTPNNIADLLRGVGRNAANWVLHELGALLANAEGGSWAANRVTASQMAQILYHRLCSHITLPTAKRLLWQALNGSFAASGRFEAGGTSAIEAIEAAEAAAITEYIYENNLQLKPMSDKEYLALAKKLIVENPEMAKTAKAEVDATSNNATSSLDGTQPEGGKTKKRNKGGKMMWFVGRMLSNRDAPRMVPNQCERAMRHALLQTTF